MNTESTRSEDMSKNGEKIDMTDSEKAKVYNWVCGYCNLPLDTLVYDIVKIVDEKFEAAWRYEGLCK